MVYYRKLTKKEEELREREDYYFYRLLNPLKISIEKQKELSDYEKKELENWKRTMERNVRTS